MSANVEMVRSGPASAFVAVGAVSWLLTLGYFAVQPVVAAAWDPLYSISANMISDLGRTSCGVFDRPGRAGRARPGRVHGGRIRNAA
jgi:hypothetical protein